MTRRTWLGGITRFRSWKKAGCFTGLEPLEGRLLMAAVAWDGDGGDNLWSTAANWSTDTLPGAADDVTIVDGESDFTVLYTGGDTTVNSMVVHEGLTIQGGSLTVAGFTNATVPANENAGAWFTGTVTLDGGTLDVSAVVAGKTNDARVSTGALVLNSGQLLGQVKVENSSITIGAGFTDPNLDLVARGLAVEATLDGNLSAGQTLTIQGTDSTFFSHGILKWQSGLQNAGTINLENVGDTTANLDIGTGTLVNTSTGVINAVAASGGLREIKGTGTFTNQGTVTSETGVFLTIAGDQDVPGRITYDSDGGTLGDRVFLTRSDLMFSSTPASATEVVVVGFDNGLISDIPANAIVAIHGTDTADMGGGDGSFSHGVLVLAQDTANNGTIVLANEDIDPSVTVEVLTANLDLNGHTLTNAGSIEVDATPDDGRFIKNGTLVNDGTLDVDSDLEFIFDAGFEAVAAAANHTNSGLIRIEDSVVTYRGDSLANQDGGTIAGTGELKLIQLSSSIINNGSISPGLSAGTLTITTEQLTQGPTGSIDIEIGGTTAGTDYDQVILGGFATLGGQLNVSLIDGFVPASSDSFEPFVLVEDSGQIDETFANAPADGQVAIDGGQFSVIYTNNKVFLNSFLGQAEVTVLHGGDVLVDNSGFTDFGIGVLGDTAPEVTFTIRNDGGSTLNLANLTVGPAGAFSIVNGLDVTSLAPGATEDITISMLTDTAGTKLGQVAFNNNDADENAFNIPIRGTVTATAPPEVTVLQGATPLIDNGGFTNFGSVNADDTAPQLTFTIRNDGGSPLNLAGLTVGPAGVFSVVNGLDVSTLAPSATEDITVSMLTDTAGIKLGQVAFNNNDADENPFNIPIRGTVVAAPPEVTVLQGASTLTDNSGFTHFAPVTVSTTAPELTFTIRNDGGSPLNLTNLTVGPAGVFSVVNGLDVSTLAPSATEDITISMATDTLGVKLGQIAFNNNDADENPFNIPLRGEVVTAGPPEVTVLQGATTLVDNSGFTDLGPVTEGDTAPQVTFTIRNDGDSALNLANLTIGPAGAFAIVDGLGVSTLAPSATEDITVSLLTDTAGVKLGQVAFNNNDSDENAFNIPLRGTVTPSGGIVAALSAIDSTGNALGADTQPSFARRWLGSDTDDSNNDRLNRLLRLVPVA